MNLARFLSPECIRLKPETPLPEENEEGEIPKREWQAYRENIIREIAGILYKSGKIQNLNKLTVELLNREKRSTSIVGLGVAMPHVRTLQAKSFTMGFLRVAEGVPMDPSQEHELIKIFIAMVAPPYDDKIYLKVYKQLAKSFLETDALDELLTTSSEGEVIKIFNEIFRSF